MVKQIIITGASGFLGRNVIQHFMHQTDTEIIGVSRTNPRFEEIEWIKADISKPLTSLFPSNVKDATVIHCAAKTEDGKLSKTFYSTNVNGTVNALNIAPEGKFIHISSSSIYDLSKPSHNILETEYNLDSYKFYNGYSYSKAVAEQIVLSTNRVSPAISLRPHAIYGAGDTTLIPKIKHRIRNGKLHLPNGGDIEHSLTYVGNVIQAIEKSITADFNKPEAFNITDSNSVNLKETLHQAIPELKKIRTVPSSLVSIAVATGVLSPYEVQQIRYNRTYSLTKAQEFLGYAPCSFDAGLL